MIAIISIIVGTKTRPYITSTHASKQPGRTITSSDASKRPDCIIQLPDVRWDVTPSNPLHGSHTASNIVRNSHLICSSEADCIVCSCSTHDHVSSSFTVPAYVAFTVVISSVYRKRIHITCICITLANSLVLILLGMLFSSA